jgi:hypothetical protein
VRWAKSAGGQLEANWRHSRGDVGSNSIPTNNPNSNALMLLYQTFTFTEGKGSMKEALVGQGIVSSLDPKTVRTRVASRLSLISRL